jgi:hypothetical protein
MECKLQTGTVLPRASSILSRLNLRSSCIDNHEPKASTVCDCEAGSVVTSVIIADLDLVHRRIKEACPL